MSYPHRSFSLISGIFHFIRFLYYSERSVVDILRIADGALHRARSGFIAVQYPVGKRIAARLNSVRLQKPLCADGHDIRKNRTHSRFHEEHCSRSPDYAIGGAIPGKALPFADKSEHRRYAASVARYNFAVLAERRRTPFESDACGFKIC